MPFPNFIGRTRYWTQERVISVLKRLVDELPGPLPCLDSEYHRLKRGRLDLPPAKRILDYYHSMARAWLAVGAPPERVSLHNQQWLPEEDNYLLERAGELTLDQIALKLRRSQPAVRARLNKKYNIASRENQGFLSAAALAKEYNCPCHRIRSALADGRLKGRFDKKRNRWEIDPGYIMSSPEALAILTAPKKTYTSTPPDTGNYYQRYGLRRTTVNGRMQVVPA